MLRPDEGRQREEGAHADGQPGALQRAHPHGVRVHLGRGHRQRHRDAHHLRPQLWRPRPAPASKPIPKGLHWDEWLGPARYREYHDGLHTFSWRSWKEFGTGTIGDMACHNLDCLFWALRVAEAKHFTVECLSQTPGDDEMYPTNNVLRWTIPARGDMPEVKIHAYDNRDNMPRDHEGSAEEAQDRVRRVHAVRGRQGHDAEPGHVRRMAVHSLREGQEVPKPPKVLPRAHGGPIDDLFYVMRNGGTPCSDFFSSAGPLASFALTGHLAMAAGRGQEGRVGRGQDDLHQHARTQQVRPPRVSPRLGTVRDRRAPNVLLGSQDLP